MKKVKVKEKAGTLTVTRKLTKQEQIHPMELDIIQKQEIETLLPIQLTSSFRGMKLRFTIARETRVIDYLSGGVSFGDFLNIARQIVKTILACQSKGISVNNLELEDSFLFFDTERKMTRLLYWPVTTVTEDVDLVDFFIRLGSRYYRARQQDRHAREAYLALFNSRAVFDAQRFDDQLKQLRKKWLETLRKGGEQKKDVRPERSPIRHDLWGMSNQKPYLLQVSTNARIELNKFPFVLGRGPDGCDYVLRQNNYVSRQHLILLSRNGRVYLRDNGTRNGTMLNEKRIPSNQPIELPSGGLIEVGREAFYFFAVENESGTRN